MDIQNAQNQLRLEGLWGEINTLEGKAMAAGNPSRRLQVDLLGLRIENLQARVSLLLADGVRLEGKSFYFPNEQDADVQKLIRRIGGSRERNGAPGPEGFTEYHFTRALALLHEGDEPKTENERKALARFRERWPK